MNEQTETDAPPRDGAFNQILAGYDSGVLLDEIGAALRECTEAAMMVGKPAKLTLELTISNTAKGALSVTPKITTKIPEVAPNAAIFFADENFNLTRNDPSQRELPLRVVNQQTANQGAEEPLRKVQAQ